MAYVLDIMADAATIITSIAGSCYAVYRYRHHILVAYYTVAIWSLTAFIRYVDFVAYYLLDPLTRSWQVLRNRMTREA